MTICVLLSSLHTLLTLRLPTRRVKTFLRSSERFIRMLKCKARRQLGLHRRLILMYSHVPSSARNLLVLYKMEKDLDSYTNLCKSASLGNAQPQRLAFLSS